MRFKYVNEFTFLLLESTNNFKKIMKKSIILIIIVALWVGNMSLPLSIANTAQIDVGILYPEYESPEK